LMRAALAEFIGTAMLVFFGVGSVNATAETGEAVKPTDYAFSFGLVVTCCAYSIGAISGGHMNPAVTFAMALTGNITWSRFILYFIAQFGGGFAGAGILYAVTYDQPTGFTGGISLAPGLGERGFVFEFMGTLLLLIVVFNVAVWTSRPLETDVAGSTISALAPLPIGFAVLAAHLVCGPYTGCGINPARVLGAIVFDDNITWESYTAKYAWIYFVGPFSASVCAPLIYYALYGTVKPGSSIEDEEQRRQPRVCMDFGGGHDDDHHFKAAQRHKVGGGSASTSYLGETTTLNDSKITNI